MSQRKASMSFLAGTDSYRYWFSFSVLFAELRLLLFIKQTWTQAAKQ